MEQNVKSTNELNTENKTSRRNFIKKWGLLSLAGLFGLSKMGNMPVVKAAVSDNAEAEDISKDIIRCSSSGVFTSGETAEDLADAVNGLHDSFSNALTDLKATDVATFVGAQGSTFTTVIETLKSILQTKSVTATTEAQDVVPDSGMVLQKVTVNPQKHTDTRSVQTITANGDTTIDLGETHNIRKVPVKVNVSATATLVYTRWSDPYSGAYNQGLVGIDLSQYVAVLMRINGLSSGDGKIVYCTKGSRVVIGDYSGTSGGGRGFTVENGGIREDINGNSYGAWGSAYVSQVWGLKNYII